MRKRYEAALAALPTLVPQVYLRPFSALREAFREGYGARNLRADAMAGLVVGIVALPLSMALAIASGVPPQHGLYTAIIAGLVIAAAGGSRTQVSGPTAAFVVILAPIAVKFGVGGLMVATILAGAFLVGLGLFRMGRLIQFIPYPVTAGFTAGIAVVIATLQVKDFLGLTVPNMPEHYLDRVGALVSALPSAHWPDLVVGAVTLAILLVMPRLTKRVPGALIALGIVAPLAALASWLLPRYGIAFSVDTIGTRFSYLVDGVKMPGIPQLPPLPALPWNFGGPDGQPLHLSFELLRQLGPSAFAIAMLGAIESLLSAVVADGMAGTKHDPDAELLAQGTGNLIAPFFGGIAATGAIARTATNIRAGGRSPVAAIVHSLFVLAAVLILAPWLSYLPMSSLAALLLLVAWNMSEAKHFVHVLKVAPKSDAAVLLSCFGLTVFFDMVVGVSAGVMLAALLFMRRMAEITGATLTVGGQHPANRKALPKGVAVYDIAGPLFFGAAQKAVSTLEQVTSATKVVILDVEDVPAMDATGLVNLESVLDRLWKAKAFVIIAGIQPQPEKVLAKAGLGPSAGRLAICETAEEALALARHRVGADGGEGAPMQARPATA